MAKMSRKATVKPARPARTTDPVPAPTPTRNPVDLSGFVASMRQGTTSATLVLYGCDARGIVVAAWLSPVSEPGWAPFDAGALSFRPSDLFATARGAIYAEGGGGSAGERLVRNVGVPEGLEANR